MSKKISIYEKQNEREILEMQAAAKIDYSSSATYNFIVIILYILIIAISIFSNSDSLLWPLLTIISTLLTIIFNDLCQQRRLNAANLREYIDAYLYNIKCTVTKEEARSLLLKKKKKQQKLIDIYCSNDGESKPRGVKNWYSDYSKESYIKQIFSCQKENIYFDRQLLNKYRIIIVLFILAIAITYLVSFGIMISRYSTLSIHIILSCATELVLMFISLLKYTITKFSCLNKEIIQYIIKVEDYVKNCERKLDMKDIIEIQQRINARRRMQVDIQNFLYNIFSNQIHKDYRYMNQK